MYLLVRLKLILSAFLPSIILNLHLDIQQKSPTVIKEGLF